jgi:tetraacyldisaccharide 4'-kinase
MRSPIAISSSATTGCNIEIAVVDSVRGFGNGMLLPAGPLREPVSRLRSVDAIIINQGKGLSNLQNEFTMELVGEHFHNLLNPEVQVSAGELAAKRLVAIAGIGNPKRFFDHLKSLGLNFASKIFPDHYAYSAVDLNFPDVDAVLLTEKDAVKCSNIASEKFWVLAVNAQVDNAFGDLILKKLGVNHGP